MTLLAGPDLLVRDIVERSSTIDERLAGAFEHLETEAAAAVVERRLAAWCDAVTKGDWPRFALRLSWDGLDLAAARRAVGPVRLREDAALPGWALLLEEWLGSYASLASSWAPGEHDFLKEAEPFPFEDVLAPFVVLARRQLAEVASSPSFTAAARADLERGLLMSLVTASADTLLVQLEAHKAGAQSAWSRLVSLSRDPNGADLYREFATGMAEGGLATLFGRYPVLARRMAEICRLWVEATAELVQRLDTDRTELERVYGRLGLVTSAQPSLSDPHNGRRRVVSLTFDSGRTLVYKPKDMGTEAGYQQLLTWLNDHGAPLDFRVLDVVDRGTHGWVELVEHTELRSQEEALRYYRRAGMLLCLFYALEGTDCHYENILANGEYPVLVDAETLMHHRARERVPDDGNGAQALANEQLDYSVLRTGMLPRWQVGGDGRTAYDVSGLGETVGQELPYLAPRWTRVNTDRMAVEPMRITIPPQTNVPILDGEQLSLREYGAQVVDGFTAMYEFLVGVRAELLGSEAMRTLARQRVRFVYRPTKVYAIILNNLQDSKLQRDGAEQSIHVEQLGRAQIPAFGPLAEEPPLLWPVFAAERAAMARGDIPFFSARADGDALQVAPGEEVPAAFVEPGFELVQRVLGNLGEEDLRRQLAFVEGALYAQVAREPGADGSVPADQWAPEDDGPPASTDVFVAEALALAQGIADKAIRGSDGSATWIAPQYLVQAERFQLRPMDEDLYGGASGVALFLAAAHGFAPDRGYGELARAALRPVRSALHRQPDRLADDLGLGGATGIGSIVYALVRVAQILAAPELLEDARLAAGLVTDERIAADTNLDALGGSAGAILGLVALHEALPGDGVVLHRARVCAEHLLARRTPSSAGPRAWASFDGRLTTGFSHGAAGISYALLRLHGHAPDERLLAAAAEAVEYEATTYSPEQRNWADFWKRDQPLYVCSWCHGAPGIGLARLGSLEELDTPRVREDIDLALDATQGFGLQLIDHLCCGNLGRAEMMLHAGLTLDRPDLVEAARAHAWQAVRRAAVSGGFILNSLLPHGVHSPGFFQGTAGIGYELLRLAEPRKLPSVLVWE